MKTETQSVSSILVKIGEALQATELADLAKRYFSRGLLVAVGSYPEGILAEEDAPFIIVRTDDEESDISTGDLASLSVMVILACAPTRDVPTTDNAIEAAADLFDTIAACVAHIDPTSESVAAVYAAADCGTAEEAAAVKASVVAARDSMTTAYAAYNAAVSSAKAYAANLDVDNVLTQLSAALTHAGTVKDAESAYADAAGEAADLAEDAGETAKAEAAEAVETAADLKASTLTSATATATTERTKLETAWDEYETSPYIKETVAARTSDGSGLVVYGAVRMLDGFRRAVYKVLRDVDVGIPLNSITFKNNSNSHQPLDWLEVTATFGEPQSLS